MQKSIAYALMSAVLFGVSTPLAKALVGAVSPLVLAGLLYGGSGVGLLSLLAWRARSPRTRAAISLPRDMDWAWLTAAIFFGGILGPVALMYGLVYTAASTASLLLNLESVFTALIAWFLFRENFDRRIALGMAAIVCGGLLLAWHPAERATPLTGAALIAAACLCWGIDNNLTRKASVHDAVVIAALKGAVAAIANLSLAAIIGQQIPLGGIAMAAAVLGFFGYGLSLVFFVIALRELGTARTSAYFSVGPFFGTVAALVFQHDAVTWELVAAGGLMAVGVWLHLSERHVHEHTHEIQSHIHEHVHDEHHQHSHAPGDGKEPHTHEHVHVPLSHAHVHYPDIHHRHEH